MKIKLLLFSIIFLGCCQPVLAQYDFSKVDAWLAGNTDVMGGRVMLMVYKDDKVVYSHAVNQLNQRQKNVLSYVGQAQGKPADLADFTPAKREPIASCSKWLSAALIMTFVDEGKLKLTDTVGKYLPVLSQHGKGYITLAQCLSHLTAINAPPLKLSKDERQNYTSMDDAMASIALQPMEGKPGKVFHYSNDGLQIAGAVLEKISGKSFQALFEERIARPLNLKGTDFGPRKVAMPAGGALSTPDDYLNFLVMILNKGTYNGKRILSEKSIQEMQINRVTPGVKIAYSPKEAGDFGYGYGEWIMPGNSVSSPGLYGSFPWVNNTNHYAAFMMTLYLENPGRHARYVELQKLVNEAMAK